MGSMTLTWRASSLTRADLDAMPDDGRRHELIDGVIVVSPAPHWRHQDVVFSLAKLLSEHCPRDLKVGIAPAP